MTQTDPTIGHLVETAVFSQWLHNDAHIDSLRYARWKNGEVDLVSLDLRQQPHSAIKVKWSDRPFDDPREIRGIIEFTRTNRLARMPLVTTLSRSGVKIMNGIEIEFVPTSLHCYTIGRNILDGRSL